MTKKMLKFVNLKQETPFKRSTSKRTGDFNEIYDEFITESERTIKQVLSMWSTFLHHHCPLSNNIPDWLKLTAEGRLKEAYEISQRSTNNMPEVCGRICPQTGFVREIA